MNCSRQALGWVAAAIAAAAVLFVPVIWSEEITNPPATMFRGAAGASTSSQSMARSPVAAFRELLALSPDDLQDRLTNRPPEVRKQILDKVAEYEALDPDARELRLRTTELHWYLTPLMRMPRSARVARLDAIPTDMRDLVETRLSEWDILPPELQQEFLANDRALGYFDSVEPRGNPSDRAAHSARDSAIPDDERKRFAAQCEQFFHLTPDEKQQMLNTLSDVERKQMQETLRAFEKLTPLQRSECERAFTEFATMTAPEKQEFLNSAERWAQMSPKERQTWRDLVVHVPDWPPLPPGMLPPTIEAPTGMATNH